MTDPQQHRRRSQLYHWHLSMHARFVDSGDGCHVASYPGGGDEPAQAGSLGICDLSLVSRIGFKGRGTPAWLGGKVDRLPERPNQAGLQGDSSIVARLSNDEFLILDRLAGTAVRALAAAHGADAPRRCYPLPRADSHACFAITGEHGCEMLSKLCGVDLRPASFVAGSVAQTSVARSNAILVRSDAGATACFYLLGDVSAALYLWECLLDASGEYNGRAVGVNALQTLQASQGETQRP